MCALRPVKLIAKSVCTHLWYIKKFVLIYKETRIVTIMIINFAMSVFVLHRLSSSSSVFSSLTQPLHYFCLYWHQLHYGKLCISNKYFSNACQWEVFGSLSFFKFYSTSGLPQSHCSPLSSRPLPHSALPIASDAEGWLFRHMPPPRMIRFSKSLALQRLKVVEPLKGDRINH